MCHVNKKKTCQEAEEGEEGAPSERKERVEEDGYCKYTLGKFHNKLKLAIVSLQVSKAPQTLNVKNIC